jgi:hypothetical protein
MPKQKKTKLRRLTSGGIVYPENWTEEDAYKQLKKSSQYPVYRKGEKMLKGDGKKLD